MKLIKYFIIYLESCYTHHKFKKKKYYIPKIGNRRHFCSINK